MLTQFKSVINQLNLGLPNWILALILGLAASVLTGSSLQILGQLESSSVWGVHTQIFHLPIVSDQLENVIQPDCSRNLIVYTDQSEWTPTDNENLECKLKIINK